MKSLVVFVLAVVFSTVLNAAEWQRVKEISNREVSSIEFSSGVIYAGTDSLMFMSSDGGNTWRRSGLLSGSIEFVEATSVFGGRIFAGTLLHGIFVSSDGGSSWHQMNGGLSGLGSHTITCFAQQNQRLLVGTAGAGTFVLNQDEQSWSSFGNLPLNVSGTVYAMKSLGDTVFAGAGVNGTMYRLLPGATEWVEILLTNGSLVPAVSFVRLRHEVFAGTTNGVYRSSDAGVSWSSVSSGLQNGNHFLLEVVNDTLFGVLNRLGMSHHYRSTNRGANWVLDEIDQTSITYGMLSIGNKLFVAKENGLWFRNLQTTFVEEDVKTPETFELYQNFPNPFNPATTIRFHLSQPAKVSLKVLDVLGREVKTMVDETLESGSHAFPFSAEGISSGSYIYTLQVGGATKSRKLTLLK